MEGRRGFDVDKACTAVCSAGGVGYIGYIQLHQRRCPARGRLDLNRAGCGGGGGGSGGDVEGRRGFGSSRCVRRVCRVCFSMDARGQRGCQKDEQDQGSAAPAPAHAPIHHRVIAYCIIMPIRFPFSLRRSFSHSATSSTAEFLPFLLDMLSYLRILEAPIDR